MQTDRNRNNVTTTTGLCDSFIYGRQVQSFRFDSLVKRLNVKFLQDGEILLLAFAILCLVAVDLLRHTATNISVFFSKEINVRVKILRT